MNRRSFLRALIAAPIASSLPWGSIASAIDSVMPAVAEDIRLTYSDIISATLRARLPELLANIESNNVLLKRLRYGK